MFNAIHQVPWGGGGGGCSVRFWSPSFSTNLTQSSARTLSRNVSQWLWDGEMEGHISHKSPIITVTYFYSIWKLGCHLETSLASEQGAPETLLTNKQQQEKENINSERRYKRSSSSECIRGSGFLRLMQGMCTQIRICSIGRNFLSFSALYYIMPYPTTR